MTHSSPPPAIPSPTPLCAAFGMLLPLLGTDALTSDETLATRAHVSGCAWCREQRAAYDALEAAARRHYSPGRPANTPALPPFTLADIMRAEKAGADDAYAMAETTADDADDESEFILEESPLTPAAPVTDKRSGSGASHWRPKLMAEIAAALVVTLLVATLLASHLGPFGGLLSNQAPLKTPAGAVVFVHSVSWGRLQLNGQTINVTTDGNDPQYLPRGQNTLTYTAPPFPALTCTISAPAAHSDTCPIFSGHPEFYSDNQTFSGRMVDLEAVPNRLSARQRDALLVAVQQQLDTLSANMTILPGDHYATPEARFMTASRSFTITLHFHAGDNAPSPASDYCAPYCGASEGLWNISPTLTWDYIDEFGKPESVLQGPGGDMGFQMPLTLQWDGAWRVAFPYDSTYSSLCAVIVNMALNRDLYPHAADLNGLGVGCSGNPLSTYIGTLVEITKSGNTIATPEKTGFALYRAGALIALDSTAQNLAPWMPMASAHELDIGRQLGFNG